MKKKNIVKILLFILLSLLLSSKVKAVEITQDLKSATVCINGKEATYQYGNGFEEYIVNLAEVDLKYGTGAFTGSNKFVIDEKEKEFTKVGNYDEENLKLKIELEYEVSIFNDSEENKILSLDYQYDESIMKLEGFQEEVLVEAESRKKITYKLIMDNNDMDERNKIKNKKYETTVKCDETKSNGITFILAQRFDSRYVKGNVWKDEKTEEKNGYKYGNGEKNESENGIQGITVQLIEVKKVDDKYKYYIWNQTKTNSAGDYYFNNVLPGDYIVRFIYGYDVKETVNGYDYKSTTDLNYTEQWQSKSTYEKKSVARDNEARRLDLIALTANIDNQKGRAMKEGKVISKYYMYADTSLINIEVASNGENTTIKSSDILFNFKNINFGLEERPATKMTLEKHITGLNMAANGITVVNNKYESHDSEYTIKFKDGVYNENGILLGTYGTRENNGTWNIFVDLNEVGSTSRIETEYTYTLTNEGDIDYISTTLEDKFETLDISEYEEFVTKKANEIRSIIQENGYNNNIGTYLGSTYYTGNPDGEDVTIIKTSAKIKDKLADKMKFTNVKSADFTNEGNNEPQEVISKNYIIVEQTKSKFQTLRSDKEITGVVKEKIIGTMAEIEVLANPMGRRDMESTPGNGASTENDAFTCENIEINSPNSKQN